MALALTDRLPTLDKQQLLNLQTNARRLQADAGPRAKEATALLPLLEAELTRRSGGDATKIKPKRAPRPRKTAPSPAA